MFLLYCTLLLAAGPAPTPGPYVVLVEGGANDEFRKAAETLANFHKASVVRFAADKLDPAFAELKKLMPRYVAFVLPPERIDVDLVHQILARSTALDDDPFPDFEYAFVTGRDGPAAARFAERIVAAWKHDYGRSVRLFGTWEGEQLPPERPLSALKALKADGEFKLVHTRAGEAARKVAAKDALAGSRGKDALLFFSHGYPDEMAHAFRAADLRAWQVELPSAVLVNCACYNGCPGRWFAPGARGRPEAKPPPSRDDSVALAILDSGVAAYVAGIDPWHGPLANQVFAHLLDDGLSVGGAAKRMADRLALEFLPGRINFPPTETVADRFAGEGVTNRRHNGAGMIAYGDPAFAPFAKTASRLAFAGAKQADGKLTVRLGTKPLLDGPAAGDYMIPQSRLTDYYSVKTADFVKELSAEVYGVTDLPAGVAAVPPLKVKSAKSGPAAVPAKPVQAVVERTRDGNKLHVRVPLGVRIADGLWPMLLAANGVEVELEESN
jgi:hypothetical protein